MEDRKYMRVGVSDWEFMYKDESVVKLNTIQSQSFIYECTGEITIKLVDVFADKDFIEKNRSNVPLIVVTEIYNGYDKSSYTQKVCTETYGNCSIGRIEVKCSNDSASLCNILISVR